MSDLFRTLPEDAAKDWEKESRTDSTIEDAVYWTPVTIAELTFWCGHGDQCPNTPRTLGASGAIKEKPILVIDQEIGTVLGQISATLRQQGRGADFRSRDFG